MYTFGFGYHENSLKGLKTQHSTASSCQIQPARPQEDTIHSQQISKFSSNDKAKLLLNANDVAMPCYILHRIFHLNKHEEKH